MATVENFIVKVATQGVEQLNKLGSTADAVNNKLNALSGAILGVGFGAFIAGALRSADAMSDLSDATGLSVASIKAFGESMQIAGGNSKGAERAIMTLFSSIEAAAAGGLKQQEAFNKVGVSLKDLENLSEADILQKTIEGLAEIPAGAERAAAATALLGRSFRSVEAQKFLETLDPAKYAEFEAANKRAAEMVGKLEIAFTTLQQGALSAISPIIGLIEDLNFNAKDAEKLFQILGVALAGVFAAKTIGLIVDMAKVMKVLTGVIRGTVVAQTALTALAGPAGWAVIAGAATAATAAYLALDKAIGDAGDSTKELNTEAGKGKLQQTNPSTDPAKRKVTPAQNPEDQARLDSERRIAQAQSDIRRLSESTLYDEIANIRAKANADITKMEAEVNSQRLLNSVQKEREIAERRIAIDADATFQITKYRAEQEKKLADQLSSLALSTQERRDAFELEQKLLGVSGQQAAKLRAIADINKERTRTLRELGLDKTLSPDQLEKQRKALNEQYDAQVATAESQVEFQRQFETGWSRAFQSYIDNATNAASQAEAMFQSMTSNMNRALDSFVDTGKFSFSDLTNSIIKDIIKIQLRASVANLLSAGSNFLGFSLPGRAIGGPVSTGMPYMVGEQGPEMFIPAQAGNIVANNKLDALGGSGGAVNISYNIQAVDALSFKQMVARDPSFLYAVTEQGRKSIPSTRR